MKLRVIVTLAMSAALVAPVALPSTNTYADPDANIAICHADQNTKQPYGPTKITVDANSIVKTNGHGSHTGDVAISTAVAEALKAQHKDWGDIIPPFTYSVVTKVRGNDVVTTATFPGLNWTTEGQAVYNNNCQPLTPVNPLPQAHLDFRLTCNDKGAVVVTVFNTGTAAGNAVVDGQTITIAAGGQVSRTFASGTQISITIDGKTTVESMTCTTDEPQEPGKGGSTPITPITPAGTNAAVATDVTHLPTTSGNSTSAVVAILAALSSLVAAFGYGARLLARRFM